MTSCFDVFYLPFNTSAVARLVVICLGVATLMVSLLRAGTASIPAVPGRRKHVLKYIVKRMNGVLRNDQH